jgi:hypothetical protein
MHRQGASELLRGFARLRIALQRVDDALDGVFGGGAPLVGRGGRVERHQAEGVLGQGFAQLDGFRKARHDKVRHARLQQRIGRLHRAVPVGIRFDHRPQRVLRADVVLHNVHIVLNLHDVFTSMCKRTDILLHDTHVVLQRVPVQFQPVRGRSLH